MIPKSIDEIDISDIQVLIENEVPEKRTLDYKQELPKDDKDGTKAFLADVCSFANTIGGDLIYGVKEKRDEQGKTTGIPEEICQLEDINFDEFIKKYEDKIQAGIEPRIQGIRFCKILYAEDKYILIIRVPQSWAAPHRIIYNKMSHFYARRNAGNYQLDVNEIRSAFLASETVTSRIEKFAAGRLDKIRNGNTPVKLEFDTLIALHVIPLSSFTSSKYMDLEDMRSKKPPFPIDFSGGDTRYNFDGFLTFNGKQHESDAYVQLFRNGIIESVSSILVTSEEGEHHIRFSYYEHKIIKALEKYLYFCQKQEFTTPIFVFLSLINVKGCRIVPETDFPFFTRHDFVTEQELNLPEVVIRDYNEQPKDILRPLFDAIWQAGGHEKSGNYYENGDYFSRC